jgi:tetratricopeptide (TPR) repeat protein
VIGASSSAEMPREPAPNRDSAVARSADLRREPGSAVRPGSTPAARPGPAPRSDATRAPESITITPAQQPRLNPALSQAYGALQAGNLEQSGSLYAKVAQSEPLNIDALLGMAYIAAQENRTDDAVKLYVRILQLNPRHAATQAALIGLMGRADPLSAETRVKQLIAQEPSPFLHFVLGNVYADQSQWAQAQQCYFQAHHLEPDNPDYAYNLAISLDHLSQSKLALGFYRRAEQLAATQTRANFNLLHARERITALSKKLE